MFNKVVYGLMELNLEKDCTFDEAIALFSQVMPISKHHHNFKEDGTALLIVNKPWIKGRFVATRDGKVVLETFENPVAEENIDYTAMCR